MEKAKPPCCVDLFLFFCGVTVYHKDSPGLQRREAGYFCSQRSMKSPRKRMRGWRGDGSGWGEQGANVATLLSGKHFFLFLGKTDDVWGWVCGSWDLAFAAQAFAFASLPHPLLCVFISSLSLLLNPPYKFVAKNWKRGKFPSTLSLNKNPTDFYDVIQ